MKTTFKVALTVAVLLFSMLACTRSIPPAGVPVPNGTETPVEKKLSAFSTIPGTKYLIAGIVLSNDYGSLDFSAREYGGYGFVVYNYVFFDIASETYHSLLPDNNQLIIEKTGLPICCNYSENEPVVGWLYTIVKTDTNNDGVLSAEDRFTIAMSDAGGNGYVELIQDVEADLGKNTPDDATLLVFYRQNGKNYHARIDLATKSVVSTVEMPSFGEDVK